jgi:hypothetical protein
MTLLADLHSGTHGIRFNPPFPLQLELDQDTIAAFRDQEHRVDWYLEFSPLIVDLSARHDDVLREDLHIDTATVFESYFKKVEQGRNSNESIMSVPLTKRDPTWSPVISERVTIGGVPALTVIHRLTYTAGDERIKGRIIIPLEQGTLYFSALRRANMTGEREALLRILHTPSAEDIEHRSPSQAAIDDPVLDDKFPDHPLTVVRRALRWALTTPLDMTITAPLPTDPDETLELKNAGCTIRVPPRFRFCPRMAAAMDPSLTPFIRATVPQAGSYTFDVWRLPDVTVTGRQSMRELRGWAEEHLRGWRQEGDSDFEIQSNEFPMPDDRPGLSTFVQFRIDGNMNHGVANWFVDHDGTVFRICAAGSVSRSREVLLKVVNESTSTWRRLPGDIKRPSRWWKLFTK